MGDVRLYALCGKYVREVARSGAAVRTRTPLATVHLLPLRARRNDIGPPDETLILLLELFRQRDRIQHEWDEVKTKIAQAMLEVYEREQVTVRGLANALGIGPSTVEDWLRRGRRERGS